MVDQDLIEHLLWDSEFWQRRVGRVRPDTGLADLAGDLAEFDFVYRLCDAADIDGITAAEQAGFRTVDVRCEVSLDVEGLIAASAQVEVRTALDDDVARVRAMAATSHLNTRFGNDAALPRDRVEELYRRWIDRDVQRSDWSLLVALAEGSVVGYVTHGSVGGHVGSVGLIAVDVDARGSGLGRQLLTAAVLAERAKGNRTMDVVTQGGSRGALRMYQRCGFHVERFAVWLHWHRA